MVKVLALISRISLWVLAGFVGSMALFWLLYLFLTATSTSSALVYLPMFLMMVCRPLAVLCSLLMGFKLAVLCLSRIINRHGGGEIQYLSFRQMQNDAFIMVALIVLLLLTSSGLQLAR